MEFKNLIEAILFAAQKSLSVKEIKEIVLKPDSSEKEVSNVSFKKIKETDIEKALAELKKDYETQNSSFQIQQVAGAFQLVTQPFFAPWLRQLYEERRSNRLSLPALETLAIIAYRQPIARADIEAVRGVSIDGVMQTLLDRGLISMVGRAEIPGRPMLYATTRAFLEYFGLNDIQELPAVEELRRVHLGVSQAQAEVNPLNSGEKAHEESPATA